MQTNAGSRGQVRIERMFNAEEIGVELPEPHPDRALRIFLDKAAPHDKSACAPRISQLPKGVLFLSGVDGELASGCIYIYSRDSGEFYLVGFAGGDEDNLTLTEYEQLVHEYGLLEYAARAHLIDESFASKADTDGVLLVGEPDWLAA